jgi:hypothetical protein
MTVAFRTQRIDGNSKTWHMNSALHILSRKENRFSSHILIIFKPTQLGNKPCGPQIDKANDDSALSAWTNDTALPDNHVIAESMEIINIMYFEGLVDRDVYDAHYQRLVKAYRALKDVKNAKIWANRMALTLTAIYGDDYGWKKSQMRQS